MIFVKKISKHKCLEIQVQKDWDSDSWFFDVQLRKAGDHPGFYFSLCVSSFFFEFNIYDTRHEENMEEHEDGAYPFQVVAETTHDFGAIIYAKSEEEAKQKFKQKYDEMVIKIVNKMV